MAFYMANSIHEGLMSLRRACRGERLSRSWEFHHLPYCVTVERRAFKRTLSLRVYPKGVVKVIAGKTVPLQGIYQFLCDQQSWIERSLNEYETLRKTYPQKAYVDGEAFLLKGEEYFLVSYEVSCKRPAFEIPGGGHKELSLLLPKQGARVSEIGVALRRFYKEMGREELKKSVDEYSKKMGLYPKQLVFRSQKTRWGSCSHRGTVSLNWRLVAAPPDCLDYVVVHELAHLKYQNHSQKFWNLVERHSANFRAHRKWLKEHMYAFDFLAETSELHGGL